ncbi:hypothetical protein [Spiroplasma floricola]|uniref:HTH rpiR-type domain-containing protein n=1 Tax=Spiroplasma floricola 23-6 TaxID=1336749 RepID=A0A2K8SE41_9MOLU|nr:hypothetical protein [Spiroplasma floricola]AUB31692.1 hypothetical protein SFLOR_v1c06420 [Spiroplasma floricola 23-6]
MWSVYDKLEDFINNSKDSSFKIIAKNIIDLFDKGEFINQKEIAELSFVANSTITKFSKAIGYSGYKELLFTLKNEYDKYGNQEVKYNVKSKEIIFSIFNWIEKNSEFIETLTNEIKNSKCIKIYGSYQVQNSVRYLYDSLVALNKNPIIINNDYDYLNKDFSDSQIVNILVVCGKDNKSLIRNFNSKFNKNQKNFLIVSKFQESIIKLKFDKSLVINYQYDDSKSIYRNIALSILFLTIFQDL